MAKIFVLEDDLDIRELVGWILESEGYEVLSFGTVSGFMARDQSNWPDLFLLDVMLPDGSGIEVCSDLKQIEGQSHIPILIMSAHSNMEQVSGGCKAEGFIKKPFDVDHFIDAVRKQIGK